MGAGLSRANHPMQPHRSHIQAIGTLLLRAQLACMRTGSAGCAALLLCLLGAAGWAWLVPQRAALAAGAQRDPVAPREAARAVAPASGQQNLAQFQALLGEPRHVGEQVRTLFALAATAGLELKQGEYRSGYDQASGLATYRMILPVKGPYPAIWHFSLLALRAMPFAALDEITFKRDTIADATPEARLQITLFLLPPTAGGSP